jgi:two-component system, OmpR family, phosphate regulon sensor histidine kinase PhoR
VVETLNEGALDDETVAHDFLGRVIDEVDRLNELIEELLDLGRLESGRMPLHKVEIDIPTLITRPLERVRHQAVEAGVTFELEFPSDLPAIYVDQSRLVQVLVNLLSNAIKYSRPGGRVTISARPIDGAVEIAVRDEGVGILPDDLPRIFERFFKSDRARNSGGSGLGLAIAKHIANAHGGQLTVESEYGKGSTFTISIPTDDRSAAS